MYLAHFKLKEKPFLLNTDPRFLWLGPAHQEALATLCYGVRENKGLVLLTGDIGTGKTTLISALIGRLADDTVSVARMPDPGRNRNEFYFLVAYSFGIQTRVHDKESFTKAVGRHLEGIGKQGKRALLVIDEAQMMSHEILEEVRLLSNLEHRNAKLLNIFLLGQNELNQLLLEPRNRAIRERIAITYNLLPLSEDETKAYITHRLRVAGAETSIFNPGAVRKIHAYSNGSVRLINILCDLALVFGFEEDKTRIDGRTIETCKAHLCISPQGTQALQARHVPDPAATIDSVKNASLGAKTAPPDRMAPSPLVTQAKHATRTGRTILFVLLVLLSAGYLLFTGLKHGSLPAEPAVNHKILLPAGTPSRKTAGLAEPLQQPSSNLVKKSSLEKSRMKSLGENESSRMETLDPPLLLLEKALPQDAGPGPRDRKARVVTGSGPDRPQAMPLPAKRTAATGSTETAHRQTNANTVDGPHPDESKTSQSEGAALQTEPAHRSPSDPAAIIDWLLREKQKNSGGQNR